MGCQGEIYNVYGIVVSAKVKSRNGTQDGWDRPVVYEINGKLVSHEDVENIDFPAGLYFNLDNPKLGIRILGHDPCDMGSRHFKNQALLGYVVANECYLNSAEALPEISKIESWKPKLIEDIKKSFGISVDEKEIKLFLLFDSLNG